MADKLVFQETKTKKDILDTYNYNVEVFAESPDFGWSLDKIKSEIKDGWKLLSVKRGDEIVAAAFVRVDRGVLFTKNTPIKIDYQGNGFSHQIKEYFDELAKEKKVNKIVNFCPADSFRMISLNERHGYKKTGKTHGDNNFLVEWEKKVS